MNCKYKIRKRQSDQKTKDSKNLEIGEIERARERDRYRHLVIARVKSGYVFSFLSSIISSAKMPFSPHAEWRRSHVPRVTTSQQVTSVNVPVGPPDSLLWERVRERERFPSLEREAVRERDRRVIQEEATANKQEKKKVRKGCWKTETHNVM